MTNPNDVVAASKTKGKKASTSIDFYGDLKVKGQKLPDPKKHQLISFIKSGIRIAGYAAFLYSLELAVGLLIFSEAVGIYEELV